MRWLAFEALSGLAAPREKADLVGRLRKQLPRNVADGLASLSAFSRDQVRFSEEAARWVRSAVAHIPKADAPPTLALPFELRKKLNVRTLPRRGDPGATSAPLKKPQEGSQDSEESAGSGAITRGGTSGEAYRAYTAAHDRIVNAAALVDRSELAELHLKLEAELGSIRPVVARLAKRLLRVLMARQAREWRFDLEEGLLDGSRLAALVASRGDARPFKEEGESPFPSTVVTLLIDHSGSMRGRPMLIAALTVEIFARVLERCGVRCEVLGFTTREWDGGEPAREWAADGYPESPGRLNALEHIVIKSADVPWRRARVALGLFLHDEMLKENIDGEALAWAHARLLARSERGASWSWCRTARRWTKRHSPPTATSTWKVTWRRSSGKSKRGRQCSWPPSASATTCRASTATPRRSRGSKISARPSATKLTSLLAEEGGPRRRQRGLRVEESGSRTRGTGVPAFSNKFPDTAHSCSSDSSAFSHMAVVCPGRLHGFHFISMTVRGPSRPREETLAGLVGLLPHFVPARQPWARKKHSLPTRHFSRADGDDQASIGLINRFRFRETCGSGPAKRP